MLKIVVSIIIALLLTWFIYLGVTTLENNDRWLSHARLACIRFARVTVVRRIGDGKYLLLYSTGFERRFVNCVSETDVSLTSDIDEATTYDTKYHADIAKEKTYKVMQYLVETKRARNKELRERRKNKRYKKLH